MMISDHQHAGSMAVIASLLPPPQSARPARPGSSLNDLLPGDNSWDEMVRWFGQQSEWTELVDIYNDATIGSR